MKVEMNPARAVQALAALFGNGEEKEPPSINEVAREFLRLEGAYDPSLDKQILLAALR